MNTFLRNTFGKLYNAVSATRHALAGRLQGVRKTTFLLYNRIMEYMGCGQQRNLKSIVENEAE